MITAIYELVGSGFKWTLVRNDEFQLPPFKEAHETTSAGSMFAPSWLDDIHNCRFPELPEGIKFYGYAVGKGKAEEARYFAVVDDGVDNYKTWDAEKQCFRIRGCNLVRTPGGGWENVRVVSVDESEDGRSARTFAAGPPERDWDFHPDLGRS